MAHKDLVALLLMTLAFPGCSYFRAKKYKGKVVPLIQRNESIDQDVRDLEADERGPWEKILARWEDCYERKSALKEEAAGLSVPKSFGTTHRKFVEALSKSQDHLNLLMEYKKEQFEGYGVGDRQVLTDLKRAAEEMEVSYQALYASFKAAVGWKDPGAASNQGEGDAGTFYTLGIAHYDSGNVEKAVQELKKALALDPAHEQAGRAKEILTKEFVRRRSRGERLMAKGDLEEAIEELDAAAKMDPSSAEVRFLLGKAFFESGNVASATAELKDALRVDSELADASFVLGQCYLEQGATGGALDAFQRVVRLQPDRGPAHLELARIWEGRGQEERAVEAYERALNHIPSGHEAIRLELARAYMKLGLLSEAKEQCEEVLRGQPDSQNAYYFLGQLAFREGDEEKAVEAWSRLLAIDPTTELAQEVRGAVEAQVAQRDERRTFMEQNFRGGKLLYAQRKYAEAQSRLTQVVTTYPDSEEAREAEKLVQEIEREKRIENARDEVRKQFQLAKNWMLNGNFEEAVQIYDSVITDYPDTPFYEEAQQLKEKALQERGKGEKP